MIISDVNVGLGNWYIPFIINKIPHRLLYGNVTDKTYKHFLYGLNYPLERLSQNFSLYTEVKNFTNKENIDIIFGTTRQEPKILKQYQYYTEKKTPIHKFAYNIDKFMPLSFVLTVPYIKNLSIKSYNEYFEKLKTFFKKRKYNLFTRKIYNHHYNGLTTDSHYIIIGTKFVLGNASFDGFKFPEKIELTRTINDVISNSLYENDILERFRKYDLKYLYNIPTENGTYSFKSRDFYYLLGFEKYFDIAKENILKLNPYATPEEVDLYLLPNHVRDNLNDFLPLEFSNSLVKSMVLYINQRKTFLKENKGIEL